MRLCDWHIHTRHSPCGQPKASVARVVEAVRASGVEAFGLTDHLHAEPSVAALREAREAFDALGPMPDAHFGVEVSCLRAWDLDNNRQAAPPDQRAGPWPGGPGTGPLALYWSEAIEQLAPEYVIGGAHWPLGAPLEREAIIRSYHRQNLFLAQCPQVTIVAHPWWWEGAWRDEQGHYTTLPWFDDFGVIPKSMHTEFAAALREHGKYMELNAAAIFLNPHYPERFVKQYLEYVAFMKSEGVRFSLGSDAHDETYVPRLERLAALLSEVGVSDEDLWSGPG
jgi:histidinol phosphatase-like PHP family hydrolase